MKINKTLLKTTIAADTKRLRQMKSDFRSSGYQMSETDGLMLMQAKRDATIHCAIAAHARGKIHLTHYRPKDALDGTPYRPMTEEEQAKLIEKHLPPYLLPEPGESSPDKSAA